MVHLTEKDFEKMALDIVSGYFNNKVPLNDSILKTAETMGLNPAQVRQLTWRANTKTHLNLFDKQADDKNIEFPVADADIILDELYKDSNVNEDCQNACGLEEDAASSAMDFFQNISKKVEEPSDLSKHSANGTDKHASADEPIYGHFSDVESTEASRLQKKADAVLMVRKMNNELYMRSLESRENYFDSITKLSYELRKLNTHPDEKGSVDMLYRELQHKYAHSPLLVDPIFKDAGIGVNKDLKKFGMVCDAGPLHELFGHAVTHYEDTVKFARSRIELNRRIETQTK